MSSTEELEVGTWLQLLEHGDPDALAKLFSQHRNRLKRIIGFRLDPRLRGRVDPSDVLQEVFLDASQRLPHFLKKPDMPFIVWLRDLTAQRLAEVHRRHLKAQKRTVAQELSLAGAFGPENTNNSLAFQLVATMTSPSQALARLELVARMRDALQSLEPIDREVLALRHFEELTNDEVAHVLELQKSAASNRYVRALARLKEILGRFPGLRDEFPPP